MRNWCYKVWLGFISFVILILFIYPVNQTYAATRGSKVVSNQSTNIPKGTVVEDAVVLGHDVTVSGTVSEILVVVNGNVHLSSSAKTGIIVDIGGIVTEDTGANTEGMYQLSLGSHFWNGVLFGALCAFFVWVGMLAASIAGVLVSVLLSFALRNRVKMPLATVERSARRTGLIGLFVTAAVIAVSALFALVDIGIPIAVLILLLYVFAGVIGFSIVSLWIGKLITQRTRVDKPDWLNALIGASAIIISANIPVIGLVLFSVFWLIGIGAITIWIPNLRHKKE